MFNSRKTGWIGIDIGTSSVKVVQLVRRHNRLQIAAQAIVPRREPWPIEELSSAQPESSGDQLQAAASLLGDFQGRMAAATLSMALCDFHRTDQPVGTGPSREATLRQSVQMATQSSVEHWQYDCWSASPEQDAPGDTNVLTALRTWTDMLCTDIAQLGWSCQLIDGLPLAMARAVQLVQPNASGAAVAALDLGYSEATLCTVMDGRADYVRSLKDCGFQRLLGAVSTELNVTYEEAQRLLQEHGITAEQGSKLSDTGEILQELSEEFLRSLVAEISRTLAHLKGHRKSVVPDCIYLLGGGATVKGLAADLSRILKTNFLVWQFGKDISTNSHVDTLPACLLAPAIALSALAWERS
ncbi:MAG: pilus assembly protein PilM [Pirellulales bacterium]|nr:pilus assembly protein PilM [Pirellulales bacterium]